MPLRRLPIGAAVCIAFDIWLFVGLQAEFGPNGKGNLSFNCLLMLTPPEVIDGVVVHEMYHRKEMKYSAVFYTQVLL